MFLLKVQTLENINKYSDNLQSLQVGVHVLPHHLQPEVRRKSETVNDDNEEDIDDDNLVARLRDKVS